MNEKNKAIATSLESARRESWEPIALTTQELVQRLGIGRSTYFKFRSLGKMPPTISVGRRRLTTISSLNQWLQQQLEEQNSA